MRTNVVKALAIVIPVTWFAYARWLAPKDSWPAEYWWITSLFVSAGGFLVFRLTEVRERGN